jgi:hypothetical protein
MGAKLKLVFWGAGLAVEIIAHIGATQPSRCQFTGRDAAGQAEAQGPGNESSDFAMPRPGFSIRSRLETITVIILGEVRSTDLLMMY